MDFSVDKSLYDTRPEQRRSDTEERVYDLLERLSIPFIRADHDEAATIDMCGEIEAIIDAPIVKNLFLCNTQKTKFYMLIMPGSKVFKTKDLSKQIGSARLSFGDAEHMEKYLGVRPGSMSVFGLINDTDNNVSLLIDREVCDSEFVGFHPCVNTSTLRVKTDDILKIVLPATAHEPRFVEL